MSFRQRPNIKIKPGVRLITGGEIPFLGFWSEVDMDERLRIAREFAGTIRGTCRIRDEHGVIIEVSPWADTFPGVTQNLTPYGY